MSSLEVNKAVAAVLVAGIAFFLSGTVADVLIQEPVPAKTAIQIDIPQSSTTAAAKPKPEPIANLLAKADVKKGEAFVNRVCSACHSFNDGGKTIVGPNLYNVVGGPHAHIKGFDYSDALKAKKGPWTFSALNKWLTNPAAYAPGTHMTYSGIKNPQLRADVIDYLHTLSPHPLPLPKPVPEPAAAPAGKAAAAAPSFDTLLASADPAKGKAWTEKLGCVACHTFNEGGAAGIGPNLYNVVGGPHAHMQGFAYSDALKAKKGPWTFAELNTWLTNPAAYAPGTHMTFQGIKSEKVRADVVDYLRTLSPKPLPLPKPAAPAAAAPAKAAAATPSEPTIDTLLASADPARGKADTQKYGCVACHTFNEGGAAGIGPNLYNVVGGPHAHMQGFAYSDALKAKKGPWTFAELNEWLTNPAAYAPGTHMTFMGIKKATDRADVIDYLRTLSPKPEPLPAAK